MYLCYQVEKSTPTSKRGRKPGRRGGAKSDMKVKLGKAEQASAVSNKNSVTKFSKPRSTPTAVIGK